MIKEENYSGWVLEKFVLDQPCKTSKTSETATPPVLQTPRPNTIVITSDYGGVVSEYWERWKTVAISGDEVEIRGKCYSACTLVIAAVPKDRICFSRYATLGFHLAAQDRAVMPDGRGPPGMEATQWMLDQYPKDIRNWIEIRGGLKKLPYHYDVWTLSAPDLWEMGYRRCAE